ncbi:MAG: tetratricopeptide repeat protein [Pyrinomonadaceae bacterium]
MSADRRRRICLMVCGVLLAAHVVRGQAPPTIQFFMPDGSLPTRNLRFLLTRDDGRVETVFTDTKGKFLVTGDLIREADYTINVEGDGCTYATTVATFRIIRNTPVYTPVFLRRFSGSCEQSPPGVVDAATLDVDVPAAARAAYEQAMNAVGQGETETALAAFKHALELHPHYLRARNDLGVLYLQLNRLDEAAKTLRPAVKLNKHFLYPRLNLGVVLNRQGQFKEAAEVLGALRKEQPALASTRLPLAEALCGLGKLAEAKQLLVETLADPKLERAAQGEAHFRLGAVLNREEHYAEAAAELEQAAALDPKSPATHLQLGGAFIQLKRLAEAERELLRAYELGGSSAGAAQLLLGQVYYMQKKYERALLAFEQYLKDVPNAPNAAQISSTIEELKAALNKK